MPPLPPLPPPTARPSPSRRRGPLSGACGLVVLLTLAPAYAHAAELVHIVGKGQTLGRIAKRYRVSVEALREANGLRAWQQIHPGLSLIIPGKEDPKKPGAEPVSLKGWDRGRGSRAGAPPNPRVAAKGKGRGNVPGGAGGQGAREGEELFHGPKRKGFVRLVRGDEKLEVQTLTRHGHLAPTALAGFDRLLRFYPTGAKIAIDPRLAALVGQVSDHFGGRTLHVVSGFRPYTPAQYTPHSNHNVGRAMDFSVEGVPNTVLRDFCRTFRNAGVGYYPNSTFVHLDVRTGKTYWVDYARAGEAPRYDSPGSQGSADEASRDVEPHEGAGVDNTGPTPTPDTDPGSPATR